MTSVLPVTWHPALWVCLTVLIAAYVIVTRRPSFRATRSQRVRFACAIVALLVACGWPLGDLALHVSLSATVTQRLLLMLVVAPLLIKAIPTDLVAAATRPAPIDRLCAVVTHPAIAIVVVTVVGTVTLLPGVVAWGASTPGASATMVLVTLCLGVVLWLPVFGIVPGSRQLSPVARGGYLLAASLVVTSLSFIWIFAKHPLYHSFMHQESVLGLSPIVDQQLAGFVSKFGAYVPLWTIAFVLFSRAADASADDESTLRWSDVQRHLERVERQGGQAPTEPPL